MPYKDPAMQREYVRLWVASRKYAWFKDKVCARCGSKTRLELDHKDRATKVSHKIWSWSPIKRDAELKKCQVLCYDCHKVKTRVESSGSEHGKAWNYIKYGCRCELCVAAKRATYKANGQGFGTA
jgi:5-methylcytosine-specific restriction endonuclease McrA